MDQRVVDGQDGSRGVNSAAVLLRLSSVDNGVRRPALDYDSQATHCCLRSSDDSLPLLTLLSALGGSGAQIPTYLLPRLCSPAVTQESQDIQFRHAPQPMVSRWDTLGQVQMRARAEEWREPIASWKDEGVGDRPPSSNSTLDLIKSSTSRHRPHATTLPRRIHSDSDLCAASTTITT